MQQRSSELGTLDPETLRLAAVEESHCPFTEDLIQTRYMLWGGGGARYVSCDGISNPQAHSCNPGRADSPVSSDMNLEKHHPHYRRLHSLAPSHTPELLGSTEFHPSVDDSICPKMLGLQIAGLQAGTQGRWKEQCLSHSGFDSSKLRNHFVVAKQSVPLAVLPQSASC